MEEGVGYGPGRNGEELGDDAEIETQLSAQHGRATKKRGAVTSGSKCETGRRQSPEDGWTLTRS
jgi:hypothetical protein